MAMSQETVEQEVVDIAAPVNGKYKSKAQEIIEERVADGWRLAETFEIKGTTHMLVFER